MKNLLYKSIIFFFLLFLSFSIWSQNLIPNPSFEEVNVCQKYKEPCSPKAWRSTELKGFVYGEYLGEKKNKSTDPIIPPDGNRFISLRMFNKAKAADRTFVQVPLLCPLEEGRQYQISFQYYSPVYHIDHIGMVFSNSLNIFNNNTPVMEMKPQVVFPIPPKIKHRTWQKATATYIATGKEVGLILGNFMSDAETEIKALFKPKKNDHLPNRVYYIFDDFKMESIEKDSLPDCDSEAHLLFLYKDTTRHIPNRPVVTIKEYPDFPEVIIDTTVSTTMENNVFTDSIKIGNTVVTNEEDFVIEDITFETNSAVLNPEAYPAIEAIIAFLQEQEEYRVTIVGHTDNVGEEDQNQRLSMERAQAVTKVLNESGIPLERITPLGKGETEPVAENETEEGRARNRRVVFRFAVRR